MPTLLKVEPYYCTICNKLFNEVKSKPFITREQFVDNQICLLFDLPKRFTLTFPLQLVNCLFCKGRFTVNVNDVISGRLTMRSEKLAESKDRNLLKYLGEMLKQEYEITGYFITFNYSSKKYILYNDNKRIKRKIIALLGLKTKPLNTKSNK